MHKLKTFHLLAAGILNTTMLKKIFAVQKTWNIVLDNDWSESPDELCKSLAFDRKYMKLQCSYMYHVAVDVFTCSLAGLFSDGVSILFRERLFV